MRPRDNEYVFYDGPPFPTEAPPRDPPGQCHPDMVPRYWTMRGYRVERSAGTPMGCLSRRRSSSNSAFPALRNSRLWHRPLQRGLRALVGTNTETWSRVIRRVGRWVDFENDYKTMDTPFMESVWWVFRSCGTRAWSTAFRSSYSWGRGRSDFQLRGESTTSNLTVTEGSSASR